ncbi:MAG: hypothetical protein JW909_04795 [Planctomycetes bacterium]|nr:hypothetical protein [Planctomycetota bacterium]
MKKFFVFLLLLGIAAFAYLYWKELPKENTAQTAPDASASAAPDVPDKTGTEQLPPDPAHKAAALIDEARSALASGDLDKAVSCLADARSAKTDAEGADQLAADIQKERDRLAAEDERLKQLDTALQEARQALDAADHDSAIAKSLAALDLDPGNETAQALLEKAAQAADIGVLLSLPPGTALPVNPMKQVPDISYRVLPSLQPLPKEVKWNVRMAAVESGKPVTYDISQGDNKLAPVILNAEPGVLTPESGKWHTALALMLSFSKAKGEGTMRFALFELDGVPKENKGRVSNWLPIPVKFEE